MYDDGMCTEKKTKKKKTKVITSWSIIIIFSFQYNIGIKILLGHHDLVD
jgi:uncharacterized membrane-anchored protein YitT (DUF2179 family)